MNWLYAMCWKEVSVAPKTGARQCAVIDAEADAHLWAEMFDRDLADLFELQDEVTTAIVGAIEPELLRSERESHRPPAARKRGRLRIPSARVVALLPLHQEDSIEAQGLFRRALAIDPEYPQPVAQLAISLCNSAYLGWVENDKLNYVELMNSPNVRLYSMPATRQAHFALGSSCMWTHRSDRAMSSFNEAIKLNPSYAAAHVLLGSAPLRWPSGGGDRACQKGIRLSPRILASLFGWLHSRARITG